MNQGAEPGHEATALSSPTDALTGRPSSAPSHARARPDREEARVADSFTIHPSSGVLPLIDASARH
jgi:hypothetical protein